MNENSQSTIAIDSRRGFAMFMMVISSTVISFGGLLLRNMEAADPLQINVYRAAGLLGAVTVFLAIRYRGNVFATVKNIGRLGLLGGTLLAFAGVAHMQAMANTTIANALFVLGAIPFFAALFARILLKEKLRTSTLLTMMVAAAGLVIMVREGIALGSAYGNIMGIITAVLFALYAVIVRSKRKTEMIPVLLVSTLVMMITASIANGGDLQVSWFDLLLCLVWGAVLSGVANLLFIFSSRHLATAEVTLFMLLEFALGPVWVWLFVDEVPSRWTIVGGILILSAVAIRAVVESTSKPKIGLNINNPV